MMTVANAVHGLGFRLSESRPLTDGSVPCVACHRDGRFSYWSQATGSWIENDRTIPQVVINDLPEDERGRVMRAMTAAGVMPA